MERFVDPVASTGGEAYPVDRDFPQLEVASDPVRMLEVFRAHLKSRPGRHCEVMECRPFRFRFRQSGDRCVLQYTLRLHDPYTGRRWDQWVTVLLYAKGLRRLWHSLRSAEPAAEVGEPWRCLEPLSYVPELEMVLVAFPYDRRLPELGRVLNGATRDLDPLLLARLGPGPWRAREGTIEPVRYRTELGAALRYVLTAEETEGRRQAAPGCYLKVYRNSRGRETYELLRAWWEQGSAARGYELVRPLAYWEDHRTLILEEAPGRSLGELIRTEGEALGPVRSVARAVAAFHQDHLPIRQWHTRADQLGQLQRAAAVVEWACPEARSDVQCIRASIGEHLQEVPAGPFHGDLKIDHVFLSGDRVVFVDADSLALGDPARDAAHFCSYVTAGVGLEAWSRMERRTVAEAFAREYFRHAPESWRRQLALHYAGALVEVACGIFRSQGATWRDQARAAIEEARDALAGKATLGVETTPVMIAAMVSEPQHASPARAGTAPMTELQVALMQMLWTGGEASVREVARNLRRTLNQAVTVLGQLERMGVVARRAEGRRYLYRAVTGQQDVQRSFVEDLASLADGLFEGDVAALVCQLVRARDVDADGVARVIGLLKERQRELEEGRP